MKLPMPVHDNTGSAASMENGVQRWLPLQLQAWARHGIHIGITCSQRSLRRYSIRTACINITPVRDIPQGIDIVVGMSCDVMWYRYPHRHHSVIQRGERNRDFLNPVTLRNHFLPMIRAIRRQVSAVLLSWSCCMHVSPVSPVNIITRLNS
jgi:hypothetical protein